MNRTLIVAVAMTATSFADDAVDYQKIVGTRTYIQRTNSVQTIKDAKQPIFRDLLVRFSVTPSAGSSPQSFVVAGKVVDNNGGAPQELVSLLFASPLHAPRLAALTNVDGEFRFRIWLKEDQRELRLQTPTLDEGILYLGSRVDGFDDGGSLFGGVIAYAYSFRELLATSAATPKPNQPK